MYMENNWKSDIFKKYNVKAFYQLFMNIYEILVIGDTQSASSRIWTISNDTQKLERVL